ncbi:MAG: site-specific DNA-methyltransferase [Thermodesulfovibrio sp.]|nr:site-specific DNA-methyltransferase [Thermodesulfovibrio sp.]
MSFTEKWLSKAYRLLKEDGRICFNILLDKNKGE